MALFKPKKKRAKIFYGNPLLPPWMPEMERKIRWRYDKLAINKEGNPIITNRFEENGEYTISDMVDHVIYLMNDELKRQAREVRHELGRELKHSFEMAASKQFKKADEDTVIAFLPENVNRIIDTTVMKRRRWYELGEKRGFGRKKKDEPVVEEEEVKPEGPRKYYKNLNNQKPPKEGEEVLILASPVDKGKLVGKVGS